MEKTNLPLPESIQQIISRVKHLEIRARKLIKDQLTSQYHSVFKGKGIEFSDVREYTYGDDIRDIDWNVTARMQQPYVKQFVEERQLTVYFVLDISHSAYAGQLLSRRQIMAEVVAFLGFMAFYNQDRVGLVLHTTEIEHYIPAKHNYSQLLRIIRDSWYYPPRFRGTSLARSFSQVAEMIKKPAILFLIGDFLDGEYDRSLSKLCDRHEVIPIVIHHPEEKTPHPPSLVPWNQWIPLLASLFDLETRQNQTVLLQKDSRYSRYEKFYTSLFHRFGLDHIVLASNEDYLKALEMLLKRMAHFRHTARY
jgi:uncharacterized protein (DUF58 family)